MQRRRPGPSHDVVGPGIRCEIIGTGRTPLTDEQFRDRVRETFAESKDAVDTNDPRWLEPVWNRSHIDYVEITAVETLGVERRAAFYEETGALREMGKGQRHDPTLRPMRFMLSACDPNFTRRLP